VSFDLSAGETFCLVGESGSGKTIVTRSLTRLIPTRQAHTISGSVVFDGADLMKMSDTELQRIRGGSVGYVFQDPAVAFNPCYTIGEHIKESLRVHRPSEVGDAEVIRLISLVGIAEPDIRAKEFPSQLSGGMLQRAMIALALASRPRLLIADEPTSSLDATTQSQILDLLIELKRELDMTLMFITHNLAVVSDIADRIAVMRYGRIVEIGSASALIEDPLHPYTRSLIDAVPTFSGSYPRSEERSTFGSKGRPGLAVQGKRQAIVEDRHGETNVCSLREVSPGRWVELPFV